MTRTEPPPRETTKEKRDRVNGLKKLIRILENEIEREERACPHEWNDPEYDPVETPRMEFDHYEGHGSDPYPVMRRAGTNTKPRWKQTCRHCGKTRYTEKTRPTGHVPDFS